MSRFTASMTTFLAKLGYMVSSRTCFIGGHKQAEDEFRACRSTLEASPRDNGKHAATGRLIRLFWPVDYTTAFSVRERKKASIIRVSRTLGRKEKRPGAARAS